MTIKKPLEQRSFESVSKAIEARKKGKPSIFNRLFKGWLSPPESQDWVVDAQWEKCSKSLPAHVFCYTSFASHLFCLQFGQALRHSMR
ncbi:hypothetical protein P4S68_16590 [Pseudoalteromonas sp. Hal099]